MIGGISSGYYISRKAWDDPDKREAAVNFVSYMTSDELVPVFAMHTATALNSAPEVHEIGLNSLQKKAMEMMAECTSLTEAMQDTFLGKCRVPTFDGLPLIVEGTVRAEDAVQKGFDLFYK